MLTQRNIEILKIIVDEYIQTGEVLGSKLLLKKYDLGISSATVRNDMAKLEELELVYQPYNSAGRLPTSKGIRAFVNYMMKATPEHLLQNEEIKKQINNIYDFGVNISSQVAKNTGEISFFILEENNILEYSGIGNFLENNHSRLGNSIFSIIKMLEDKDNFCKFVGNFPLNENINIFIGEENILPFLKDYTIIIKKISIGGKKGYIGLIGSLKMNYSFNISVINGII